MGIEALEGLIGVRQEGHRDEDRRPQAVLRRNALTLFLIVLLVPVGIAILKQNQKHLVIAQTHWINTYDADDTIHYGHDDIFLKTEKKRTAREISAISYSWDIRFTMELEEVHVARMVSPTCHRRLESEASLGIYGQLRHQPKRGRDSIWDTMGRAHRQKTAGPNTQEAKESNESLPASIEREKKNRRPSYEM